MVRQYALLPNTVTTVKGEALLFDKMTPFLSATEKWLEDNFTSEEVLSAIADLEASHTTRMLACQIAAYDAFHRAIPHLDVILTPNGSGKQGARRKADGFAAGASRPLAHAASATLEWVSRVDRIGAGALLFCHDVSKHGCHAPLPETFGKSLGEIPCVTQCSHSCGRVLCQAIPFQRTTGGVSL